jgi:serine/threonine protein kinase
MQSYRTGSLDGRERGIDLLERRRVQEALRARLFGGKPAPVCVGRFELQRRLGAGAMGIVYEAHDPQLRRQVALKMLNGVALQEGEAFFHEAQALARLSHPNVLQIHEAGVHEDAPFLVSELMHGGTLRSWMSEARPWREVLRMLIQVGRGLHAAHQRGLVHRDIKPENVLIGADGQPRVADFGLALVPSPLSYHESHQPIAGTPRYMAPEQMRGERVEPASDQFSFCVMAFEALYGAFPFEGATSADVLGAIEAEALRTPPARHPAAAALPALRRGLRASAAARHPSMAELLETLDRLLRRRSALWLGALVLALVAGGGGGAWVVAQGPIAFEFQSREERDVYHKASELTQRQRYVECSALLAGHPASENLTRFRIACARASQDAALLEGACRDWERHQRKAPPSECSAPVREARKLFAARRYAECLTVMEKAPYSADGMVLAQGCANGMHSIEGYFRVCNYHRKGNPSAAPCKRLSMLGPPPGPP